MIVSFNGLVVREQKNDDYGKFLTVITDTYGRIFMSAKGVRSINNKNAPVCFMFAFGEFMAYYRNNHFTLKSSNLIRNCVMEGGSIEQFSLASYIAELTDIISQGEQDTRDILERCVNVIHILYKNDRPRKMIKAVYELRIMCLAGYMPDICGCAACSKEFQKNQQIYFYYIDGVFRCKECPSEVGSKKILISYNCYDIIRYVVTSPDNKAYALKIPKENEKEFYRVCQEFVIAQIENKPNTLEFYNSIEESNG